MPGTIQLSLQGLIATFFNRTHCMIGVLKDPPAGHALNVEISKTFNGVKSPIAITVRDPMVLNVTNTTQTEITRFRENQPVNRMVRPTPSGKETFNWVVDLDNPSEFYSQPIGAKKAGFSAFMNLNVGELYAKEISVNKLLVQRGMFSPYTDFGYVAVTIGIDIELDRADSKAILTSGGHVVFESEANASYEIDMRHEGPTHPAVVVDANYYYKAMGLSLCEAERIRFMSISSHKMLENLANDPTDGRLRELLEDYLKKEILDSPPAGPEAACFPPAGGGSYPPN